MWSETFPKTQASRWIEVNGTNEKQANSICEHVLAHTSLICIHVGVSNAPQVDYFISTCKLKLNRRFQNDYIQRGVVWLMRCHLRFATRALMSSSKSLNCWRWWWNFFVGILYDGMYDDIFMTNFNEAIKCSKPYRNQRKCQKWNVCITYTHSTFSICIEALLWMGVCDGSTKKNRIWKEQF